MRIWLCCFCTSDKVELCVVSAWNLGGESIIFFPFKNSPPSSALVCTTRVV